MLEGCFLKHFIFIVFCFFPHFSLSWNSTCYSPVQMASLLSKPKKSGPSLRKMKSQIRFTERAIDKVRDRLDEEIGRLADSLEKSKLDGMRPGAVANDIAAYIENNQDGWDCPGGGVTSLAPPLFFILKEQFPFLLEQFVSIFISPAYAGKAGNGLIGGEEETEMAPIADDAPPKVGCTGETVKNSVGDCVSCSSISTDKPRWTENGCESCLIRQGWNGKTCVACEPDEVSENSLCRKCKSNEEVRGTNCVCPTDKGYKKDGRGECVKKTDEEKCREEGKKWLVSGNGRKCCQNNQFLDNNSCVNECPIERPKADTNDICTACKEAEPFWNKSEGMCEACSPGTGYNEQKGTCELCLEDQITHLSRCVRCGPLQIVNPKNREQCMSCTEREKQNKKCWPKLKEECEAKSGKWQFKAGNCECPSGTHIKTGNNCRLKTEEDKCTGANKHWSDEKGCIECKGDETWNGTRCLTKEQECKEKGDNWHDNECHDKCTGDTPKWDSSTGACVACEGEQAWSEEAGDCKDCPSGQVVKAGRCSCPDWKKDEAFRPKGIVKNNFCDNYAKDKADCRKALNNMKSLIRRLAQLDKNKERLEDALSKAEMSALTKGPSKTEASGLCFDCLKRTLAASRPSTGQQIGNILQALTGVGIGLVGYKMGQRAQIDANTMRVRNGYEVQNDYYSFMGAEAGIPYLANGLYGMTRVNTPQGGWSCSPTVSQGHHPHHGHGFRGRYY